MDIDFNVAVVSKCLSMSVFVYLLQILKPADKKKFPYGGLSTGRPQTPPRGGAGAAPAKGKGKS